MDIHSKGNFIIGTGLDQTTRDGRDFSLGGFFGSVPKSALPKKSFIVANPKLRDQGQTDMCTAFAVCEASEPQEDTFLSPNYQFAKTKQLMRNPYEWGATLRTAAKSAVKYGSLPEEKDPHKNLPRDFVADWENWPTSYDRIARKHKKKSYFSVDGHDNLFDSIRSALWMFRTEERLVMTGSLWRQSWTLKRDGVIADEKYVRKGFGHAFILIGQEIHRNQPYLVAQLSNGKQYGNGGYFSFPRGVVNREFASYGALMFQDQDAEEVKKAYWTCWQRWLDTIRHLFY